MIIKVIRDTFPVKDLIKKLGGRWNSKEKYWYFEIKEGDERKIDEILRKLSFKRSSEKAEARLIDGNTIKVHYDVMVRCIECGRWIWKKKEGVTLRDSNGIWETICDKCYNTYYKGTHWTERSWY